MLPERSTTRYTVGVWGTYLICAIWQMPPEPPPPVVPALPLRSCRAPPALPVVPAWPALMPPAPLPAAPARPRHSAAPGPTEPPLPVVPAVPLLEVPRRPWYRRYRCWMFRRRPCSTSRPSRGTGGHTARAGRRAGAGAAQSGGQTISKQREDARGAHTHG